MSPDDRDRVILDLDLELEVSVVVRRLKRVIAERARTIHPDLTPTGYLMLVHMSERGPVCVPPPWWRPSTSTRVRSAGTSTRSSTWGWRARSATTTVRRARLGHLLNDWSDDELSTFVATLGRYNTSLG